MFILYASIAGWTEIDRDEVEENMIPTIGDYLTQDNNLHFIIKERINKTDVNSKTIIGLDGYIDYIQDFNYKKRIENIGKAKTKRLVK